MDLAVAGDYIRLRNDLDPQPDEQMLVYLSVPPSAAASIVDFLGAAGLNTPNIKLLFEKPFGFDLESAEDFIERTGRYYSEDQIFRIDHYMAKEVAAEVINLRSNAENSQHQWGSASVAAVSIVAIESIGIEDRANFYEETGALRDFIQGHLMQLLSLVLMDLEPPFSIDDIAERRLRALLQLREAEPQRATRAQYDGYQDEVKNPGSTTETFASVQLESNDERWKAVPLRLTTGKSLNSKRSAITVTYTDGSEDVFEEGTVVSSNAKLPQAYERVLVEAIRGRKYIFTTSPEIIRSWQIVAPLQKAWAFDNEPLRQYPIGTSMTELL
jgi:glucose-6-phosphate 1-dehydrogenase